MPLASAQEPEVIMVYKNKLTALVEAMGQLLDDMGENGQHVCGRAKALARVAYEAFRNPEEPPDGCVFAHIER